MIRVRFRVGVTVANMVREGSTVRVTVGGRSRGGFDWTRATFGVRIQDSVTFRVMLVLGVVLEV